VRILARHVAAAGNSLVADLVAAGNRRIDLVPIMQRLALEIIGSAMFSLEMEKYGAELRQLILRYAARLGRPTFLDFMLPLQVPTPYDFGRLIFRRRWSGLVQHIIRERRRRIGEDNQLDLFDLLVVEHGDNEAPSVQLVDPRSGRSWSPGTKRVRLRCSGCST
jgi:cytochrome P450